MKTFEINLLIIMSLILILSSCEKQEGITEPQISVQEDVFDPSGIQTAEELSVDIQENNDLPI